MSRQKRAMLAAKTAVALAIGIAAVTCALAQDPDRRVPVPTPVPAPQPANRPAAAQQKPTRVPKPAAKKPDVSSPPVASETGPAHPGSSQIGAGQIAAGQSAPIDDATWAQMQGKSWKAGIGCPKREDLALLKIPYVDFFAKEQVGDMVVAAAAAADVLSVFAELHRLRFPIASMRLVDVFAGNDLASMAANNTSAFNCRAKTGGTSLSEHSFGLAIDLNPIQNPYVTAVTVLPRDGKKFSKADARVAAQPGLIVDGDAVVTAFARIGWKWGGAWGSPKDYQHFSKSGR